jgi:hypothetical protein
MRNAPVILALTVMAALAACGKSSEKTAEKAAETMIESAAEKDGSKTDVDLSGGTSTITTTDASGKTTHMEMGGAKVSEADLGVPFYPGTQPIEGQSSKISTAEGSTVTVALQSDDPTDKVAAFYREQLKAQADGRQLMDMSGGDGNFTLMLADDKTKHSIQVMIGKGDNDKGSQIHIVANRGSGE